MSRNVYLTRGLVGRDQDIDLFEQIFELSQLVTVETANPALDLISFAHNCSEFWVINTGHSVPSAVIVQETPPGQSVSTPPNNCLGLHTTPCPAPSHELPHMNASHESITEDANLGEPLMEYPEPPHGAEDAASLTHQAPNLQLRNRNTGYSSFDVDRPSEDKNIAGFIYLQPSSHSQDELHFEEYSVGVILRPHCRGLGVAEKAMHLALDVAFAHHDVHRVQARLINCYENDKAFTFFTRM
jgi:RimJ/RimL family protein N-acetyltransferase